ncbi:MAG: AsmA family protein [Alphaproteobacteria bacterium]|nr:AsmA family protein [Alphaproteobacteria bacterium]
MVKLAASAKSLTSLRRTLEVAKIFAAGRFEAINPGRMTLNGTVAASFSKMTVDIKSRIGTSRFDVKGTMRPSPAHKSADIDRANLDIDISSPSLRTAIDQFNLPLTRPGLRDDHPLRIKGHLTLGPDMMTVAGKINIATGVISVTGRREGRSKNQSGDQSNNQDKAGSVDMTVDVQGPQTREFIRGLGIDFQPAARKLGPIAVKFRLTGNHDQYALNNIAGTLGSVKLDGSGKIDLGSARPYFDFNLKAGNIPLDNFLKTNNPKTPGKPTRKTTGKTTGEYGQWNRQAMDLSLLSAYNGRVKISADSLHYNKFIFKKPVFEAVLNDGILAINNFTGQLFGGTATMSGQLASAKGDSMPKIAVTIDLKKASLSRAGKILAGVTPVSGRFDLTAKFAGEGVSQYDIISSLSGNGKLVTGPGIITGIDIPTLSKQLSTMNSNDAFANLLRTALAGGKTSYKGSISHIVAKDGRINFNPFDIALDGANSTVKMSLDLLNWTIHSQGSLLLVKHPDAPPIGVLINGTISSPDIRYRTERLKKYVGAKIASHMLQKLVGGKGGLEGMFGTGSPQKKPASPPPASSPTATKNPTAAPTGHSKQPTQSKQPARSKRPSQSKQPTAPTKKSGEDFSKRLLQKLFGKDKKAAKDGPQ